MRPRLLDLFCGAGGAGMGYHRAGFDVVGVDINPQPRYPLEFHQADALTFPLDGFDTIHASPPCQAYSTITRDKSAHPDLIAAVRGILEEAGVPYVIENVEGARDDLRNWVRICGSGLGLQLRRHRYFESNMPLWGVPCAHAHVTAVGVYGHVGGGYRRITGSRAGEIHHNVARNEAHGQQVMGMPWADWYGCTQAIPPAYTQFIGEQLLAQVGVPA